MKSTLTLLTALLLAVPAAHCRAGDTAPSLSLYDAVKAGQSGLLAPRERQSWRVTLRIET